MFFELIATFAAGFVGAGAVLLLNSLLRGRLPRWAMPVAAGLAMFGVTVANEYSWGARTAANLPQSLVVVDEVSQKQWYRPWSYAKPLVIRLVMLDRTSVQTNPQYPDIEFVSLWLFARWAAPIEAPQLVHCANGLLANATTIGLEDPSNADWVSADPAMIARICAATR